MQSISRQVDVTQLWLFFAVLLVIAFFAFWPTYFSPGLGASVSYVHFHAATATLWMIALIAQPWLIRSHRYDLHRAVGRLSFVLVPVLLISMILLANFRIRNVRPEDYAIQTYVLYLQVSLLVVFAVAYGLSMLYRRQTDIHARFMVCTGLTLVDPVFARLFFWIHPDSVMLHQWFTFGLTDLILIALIWRERRNIKDRWVFRSMLCLFVVAQIPALLAWTNWPIWQSFAAWFRSIPLT